MTSLDQGFFSQRGKSLDTRLAVRQDGLACKRIWVDQQKSNLSLHWVFASGSFLQVIGDTHGYDKATGLRIVQGVSLALANKHGTWVKFLTTMEGKNSICARMYKIAGFPCLTGCINCTHICIQCHRSGRGVRWNVFFIIFAKLGNVLTMPCKIAMGKSVAIEGSC